MGNREEIWLNKHMMRRCTIDNPKTNLHKQEISPISGSKMTSHQNEANGPLVTNSKMMKETGKGATDIINLIIILRVKC